eukprot:11032_1
MAVILRNMQKIDRGRKATVFGFIREMYDDYVPAEIVYICVLFYGNTDGWDPEYISTDMSLDLDNDLVTQCNTTNSSSFLKNTVESGYHEFKITNLQRNGPNMMIGVWRVQNNDV